MRRSREQSGHIFRRSQWWMLRYRETVLEDGQLVRRQFARQLEPIRPEHKRLKRPPPEIEDKAKQLLQPLNTHAYILEATQNLGQFAETVYFPNLETQKRASTVKGYKARWTTQLEPRCGECRLRDFRTSDAQRLLQDIARENPTLLRSTLHHFRSLLSGMFKYAIQQGYLARTRSGRLRSQRLPRATILTRTRSRKSRACCSTCLSRLTRSRPWQPSLDCPARDSRA
jgi:hypothetical protein